MANKQIKKKLSGSYGRHGFGIQQGPLWQPGSSCAHPLTIGVLNRASPQTPHNSPCKVSWFQVNAPRAQSWVTGFHSRQALSPSWSPLSTGFHSDQQVISTVTQVEPATRVVAGSWVWPSNQQWAGSPASREDSPFQKQLASALSSCPVFLPPGLREGMSSPSFLLSWRRQGWTRPGCSWTWEIAQAGL